MLQNDLTRRAVTSALALAITIAVVAVVRVVLHGLFGRQDAPRDLVVSVVVILGLAIVANRVGRRSTRVGV